MAMAAMDMEVGCQLASTLRFHCYGTGHNHACVHRLQLPCLGGYPYGGFGGGYPYGGFGGSPFGGFGGSPFGGFGGLGSLLGLFGKK